MRYPTLALTAAAILAPAAALAGSHGTTSIDYGQSPAYGVTGAIPVPTAPGTPAPTYQVKATTPLTVRVTHSDGGLFCAKVAEVKVCNGPASCVTRKIGTDGLCNFNANDATVELASPDVSAFAGQCMGMTSRGLYPWRGNVNGSAPTAELHYKNGDIETVYGPPPLVALSCDKADCSFPKVGPYVTTKFPPDGSIAPKATVGVPYKTTIWEGGWLAQPLYIVDPNAPGLGMYWYGVLQGTLTKAPTPPSRSYVWTYNAVFRCPSWDSTTTFPLKIEVPVNDLIGPHADVTFEGDLTFQGGPMKVLAHVTDNWGVKLAAARFTFPDGHVTGLALTRAGSWTPKDQTWSASFAEPANLSSVPRVMHVKIVATDDDDNTTESADSTYVVPARPVLPKRPLRP